MQPSWKKFACTLYFYSPKSYVYVRKTVMRFLPHPKSISRWYRQISVNTGVCKAAKEAIKNKVAESQDKVYVNLVIDEMTVRKKVEIVNGEEFGKVDVGKGEVATNVIVCMIVCINGKWKIPISHYFIDSLTGKDKKNIVDDALIAVHETGAKVVALTCDGPRSNLAMFNLLGANVKVHGQMKNFFPHPVTKEKVFILLDASHSLKSCRNSFAKTNVWKYNAVTKEMVFDAKSSKLMYDKEGNVIDWNFIKKLDNQVFKHNSLFPAHKLTGDHIKWYENKMNVKLAAQTCSQSVCDALTYAEFNLKDPNFKGAQGTAIFCKIINESFDILNSRTLYGDVKTRNGIHKNNINEIEGRVKILVNYIKDLKYADGTKVIFSKRRVGFLGMIMCLQNVLQIYKLYIAKTKDGNGYLPTYKLSQDHLEIFFSAVRSKGGYNNNPSCRTFTNIFKQLLLHADISGSEKGNCILLDDSSLLKISKKSFEEEEKEEQKLLTVRNKKMILYPQNDKYVNDVVTYVAGFVCRKILKRGKCFSCPFYLLNQFDESRDNEQNFYDLINVKNRGYLLFPSNDVIDICKITEDVFVSYYNCKKGIFKQLVNHAAKMVPNSTLILNHDFSPKIKETVHRISLIRKIISIYLELRINKYEKDVQRPKKKLRRVYKRLVVLNNE